MLLGCTELCSTLFPYWKHLLGGGQLGSNFPKFPSFPKAALPALEGCGFQMGRGDAVETDLKSDDW